MPHGRNTFPAVEDVSQDERLFGPECEKLTGVPLHQLLNGPWQHRHGFPPPVRLAPGVWAWRRSGVTRWLESHKKSPAVVATTAGVNRRTRPNATRKCLSRGKRSRP